MSIYQVSLTRPQLEALIETGLAEELRPKLEENYPEWVSPVERDIITQVLRKALAKGYTVSLCDGEEYPLIRSTDMKAITAEIAATDQTYLIFREDGQQRGWIWLVHGNHEDVVSDYTDNQAMRELVE